MGLCHGIEGWIIDREARVISVGIVDYFTRSHVPVHLKAISGKNWRNRTSFPDIIRKARISIFEQFLFKLICIAHDSLFPSRFESFGRIAVNVIYDMLKVTIFPNMPRAKWLHKKVSCPGIFLVEVHRICRAQLLHESCDPAVRGFLEKEMKVI